MDRVLSQTTYLRRSPRSFSSRENPIRLAPLATFPTRGRLCVGDTASPPSNLRPFGAPPSIGRREWPHEPLPLEGAAERSEAGLASFWGGARVLSLTACLRRSLPALFHTIRTLSGSLRSPPSPRGEGFVRRYSFSTYVYIRSNNARKAAFSYRSLVFSSVWAKRYPHRLSISPRNPRA